jgi:nitroreductase
MDFGELIRQRYSVRAYKPDPVDEELLRRVLEAVRLAPSAANRQAYQFIVIHTRGREAELKGIYHRSWFVQAPLVICACGVPNYNDVDVAIAMDHLVLAATELGLGTCWVAAFDPAAARQVLGLPQDVEPIAFTPLGYPADQPELKRRKDLSELVRYERW